MSVEAGRELAHKVATLLVEKSRGEEAVAILAAWAASGPNDQNVSLHRTHSMRSHKRSTKKKFLFLFFFFF